MWKEIGIIAFIAIAGLNWTYYQFYSGNQITPTEVSLNIFIEVLGTGLTILVLDQIWHAEERKRWSGVKSEVDKLLAAEFQDIFTEIALLLVPGAFVKALLDKLADNKDSLFELAQGDVKEVEVRIIKTKFQLEEEYGDRIQKKYESLSNIEMKYGRLLEASKQKLLIRLETRLRMLARDVKIRIGVREQNLSEYFDEDAIERGIANKVHEILKLLVEANKMGLL